MGLGVFSVILGAFLSGGDWKFILFVGPLALVAIVLGVMAMKSPRRGMAIAGIVLGVLGLGAAVILAGVSISTEQRCRKEPAYAAQNPQCSAYVTQPAPTVTP